MLEIKTITFLDIIKQVGNFLSLDISVNGTGWCKWVDGKLTYGVYKLQAETDLERRVEFKKFLRDTFSDAEYEFAIIEDVIGSCNFKTAKSLMQLNPILDDMVYDGEFKVGEIIRKDNKVWKKYLKVTSNYNPKIRGSKDKDIIVECMNLLGFDEPVAQDIYDAIGMAVGVIYEHYLGGAKKKPKKYKDNITSGYKIKQFADKYEALNYANELSSHGRGIQFIDMSGKPRDLKFNFKKVVEEHGDTKIFVIGLPTSKLGVIALDKKMDLELDYTYLVCYR